MNFQILIRRERSLQIHLYQEKHCLWCYRKVPSLGNMKKRSLTQASWISVEDAENKNGMEKWTVKAHLVGDRSCTVSTKMISGAGLQFSSVQSLSHVQLFVTPWIAALQASLSINNSWSSLRLTSIESVMPSSHLILRCPLLLLPPIPPSIRVFSNESVLRMRWPKYWSFSFSIIPCKEIPGLISFRMDWLDLLAVQGTLKSLLQHHSSKHQFFSAQPSSQSNSHIHTWPQEKP